MHSQHEALRALQALLHPRPGYRPTLRDYKRVISRSLQLIESTWLTSLRTALDAIDDHHTMTLKLHRSATHIARLRVESDRNFDLGPAINALMDVADDVAASREHLYLLYGVEAPQRRKIFFMEAHGKCMEAKAINELVANAWFKNIVDETHKVAAAERQISRSCEDARAWLVVVDGWLAGRGLHFSARGDRPVNQPPRMVLEGPGHVPTLPERELVMPVENDQDDD